MFKVGDHIRCVKDAVFKLWGHYVVQACDKNNITYYCIKDKSVHTFGLYDQNGRAIYCKSSVSYDSRIRACLAKHKESQPRECPF